jgi:hypothetical protein
MSLIQKIEEFLTTERIVPESRINFYISWVTQFLLKRGIQCHIILFSPCAEQGP